MRKREGHRRPGPVLEFLEARPLLSGSVQAPTTAAVALIAGVLPIASTSSTAQFQSSLISDLRNDASTLASESGSAATHDNSLAATLGDIEEDVKALEAYERRQLTAEDSGRSLGQAPQGAGFPSGALSEGESSGGHDDRGGPAGRWPTNLGTSPAAPNTSRNARPPGDAQPEASPRFAVPRLFANLSNGQDPRIKGPIEKTIVEPRCGDPAPGGRGATLPLGGAGLIAGVAPFEWASLRKMLRRHFDPGDAGGIGLLEGRAPMLAIRVLLSAALLEAANRWRRRAGGDRATPRGPGNRSEMSIPGIPGLPRT
ncbi:hypothetical protein [Singulisphaera sp. PoT]|uniref:hypothetical protein n=1 Tax=Singulisphaera sp. PoT TaxID=3411797 RepID=UPI003BF4704E